MTIIGERMEKGEILMNVCGIDVSKDSLEVVVRKQGKSFKSKTFDNSPKGHAALLNHLEKQKVARVCLEATGYYHLDATVALHGAIGISVMVVNPRAAHNFAKAMMQRTKTDAADAEILAQFAERMEFVPWEAPPDEVFAIRACGRRLVSLSKDLTKAKNQLHAFERTKCTARFIIEDVKLTIFQLEQQISHLVDNALVIIKASPTLNARHQLLVSITGVADKTAIKLLGELGVLSSDMSAKQWVAHAGLHPKIVQSGTSVDKKTGIAKTGNRYVREALYMGALNAAHHHPNVSAYYQHLVNDNGLTKLQAVCAVMRKMLLAIHGMLQTNQPFEGQRFFGLTSAADN